MADRTVTWEAQFKASGIDKLQEMDKSVSGLKDKMESASKSMVDTGKNLTKKLTAPLAGVGIAATKTVVDFDDGMSRVKGLTQASGEEFDALREKAIQLGNDTAFSAMDASEGMQILAASGMEVNDILATSEDMFTLMSAGSVEADTAASVLTNTMAQFNMTTDESQRIIDGFSTGAASAKLGVEDLEYIMGQAGGTMASMNMDMEQSIAMAGQLANAGMPIGQVGTALNAMGREIKANADDFKKLGIEVYDNNGVMKDMGSVLGELEEKLKGKTDAERDAMLSTVFSGQAMKGALDWLSLGSEGYEELTEAMYNSEGAASDLAATNEDNLGGAFRSLSSSLGTLLISIGDSLTPILKKAATFVQGLTDKFNSLDEGKRDLIVRFGLLAAAIGPVLMIGGKLLAGLTKLVGFMSIPKLLIAGLVAGFVYLLATSQTFRNSMINLFKHLKGIIEVIVGALGDLWEKFGAKIKGVFSGLVKIVTGTIEGIVSVVSDFVGLIKAVLQGDWASAWEFADNILITLWDTVKGIFSGIWESLSNLIPLVIEIFSGLFNGLIELVKLAWNSLKEWLGEKFTEAIESLRERMDNLKEMLSEKWQAMKENIVEVWNSVKEFLSQTWENIKMSAVEGWNSFKESVSNIISNTVMWIKEKWNSTLEWFRQLPGKLMEIGSNMFEGLKNGLASKMGSVIEKAKEVGTRIMDEIKELPKKMLNIGKDIMTGLANGIKDGIMAPINAAKNAASRVGGAIKDKLGIASPSKLTFAFGEFTTEGLALGMEHKFGMLDKATTGMTSKIEEPVRVSSNETRNYSSSNISFKPEIVINVNGNADDNTVKDIGKVVQNELEKAFIKLQIQGV